MSIRYCEEYSTKICDDAVRNAVGVVLLSIYCDRNHGAPANKRPECEVPNKQKRRRLAGEISPSAPHLGGAADTKPITLEETCTHCPKYGSKRGEEVQKWSVIKYRGTDVRVDSFSASYLNTKAT